MASQMRSVRRGLRKEFLQLINGGAGDLHNLRRLAREMMGRVVCNDVLMETFAANETSNALSQMRIAGEVESVGKLWKPVGGLSDADVETISVRRLKRLRGEFKAQLQLAHAYGRFEEAVVFAGLLAAIGQELCKQQQETSEAKSETVG